MEGKGGMTFAVFHNSTQQLLFYHDDSIVHIFTQIPGKYILKLKHDLKIGGYHVSFCFHKIEYTHNP